ncbi:MAG: FAD-dependent oxidoreductase, partial [Kiritimatiellia bacterium]
IYRRTRSEMPTNPIEIREAEAEGVQVEFLKNIVGIRQDGNGRLLATIRPMRLGEFDRSGRRRPEPVEGADQEYVVDTILLAIGHEPDPKSVLTESEFAPAINDRWLNADVKTGATPVPGLFAGGDVVSGPATVIEGIAAGQKAARAIDQYLQPGEREYFWEKLELPDVAVNMEQEIDELLPVEYPLLSPAERLISVEVERTITRDEAVREAGRCLRCDCK